MTRVDIYGELRELLTLQNLDCVDQFNGNLFLGFSVPVTITPQSGIIVCADDVICGSAICGETRVNNIPGEQKFFKNIGTDLVMEVNGNDMNFKVFKLKEEGGYMQVYAGSNIRTEIDSLIAEIQGVNANIDVDIQAFKDTVTADIDTYKTTTTTTLNSDLASYETSTTTTVNVTIASANTATTNANTATTDANNAKSACDTATTSANNAATSATNAATSANNAASSANSAATSANTSSTNADAKIAELNTAIAGIDATIDQKIIDNGIPATFY